MSRPMAETPKRRRPRRQFTDEFKARPFAWCSTRARRVGAVARDLDLTESALRQWVERARADRTQGKTGPDDRRARGARAAAQRESRAADGARNPKKSRGLLREAPAGEVRLHRRGEGRAFASPMLCRCAAGHAERLLRLAARGRNRRTRSDDRQLKVLVRASFDASKRRYGSPRIHEDLLEQAGARQPEARHPADAGGRAEGAACASGSSARR